ncbi:MAG: YdeI/OmpD-associated family protein [Bacteroidota bacterium]
MHSFPAPILLDPDIDVGYMKHYVPLPVPVAEALAGARRVMGTVGGHPFRRTIQERPNGAPCLRFGQTWLRDHDLTVGNVVEVMVQPDPDPDRVDLPEELEAALALDPEAAEAWYQLPPGMQRTLAYGVGRAKQAATRERRALKVLAGVRDAR